MSLLNYTPLQKLALKGKCKGKTLLQLSYEPSHFQKEEPISFTETLSPTTPEMLVEQNRRAGLNLLDIHLETCGITCKLEAHCKRCIDEGNSEHLVKVIKKFIKTCGIRYCIKPKCVSERFSRVVNKLKNARRTKNLRKMYHFVIGFPKIYAKDFKQEMKKQTKVLNSFNKALRKGRVITETIKIGKVEKKIKRKINPIKIV
ncbi:unnamed protein product, partial [marine sediment metagenome]